MLKVHITCTLYLATEVGLSLTFLLTTVVEGLGARGAGTGGLTHIVLDRGRGRGLRGRGSGLDWTIESVKFPSGREELRRSVLWLTVDGVSRLLDLEGRGLLLSIVMNMQSS